MAAKGKTIIVCILLDYYGLGLDLLTWCHMRSGCPGLGSVYLHMGPLTCSPHPELSKLQDAREVQPLLTYSTFSH